MKLSGVKVITNMKPSSGFIHRARVDPKMLVREFQIDVKATNPLNGSHGHWTQTASHREEHRTRTTSEMMAACVPAYPVLVTLIRVAPGTLDDDSLPASMKGVRDAIAAAYGLDDADYANIFFAYRQEKVNVWGVLARIEAVANAELEWHRREVARLEKSLNRL